MENASKALLIAGAILICILLIAVAMYIYNSANATIKAAGTQMSQQEKDIYNAKIKPYVNNGVKGSEVRSMIDEIISMNQGNVGEEGKFIGVQTGNIKNYNGKVGDDCEDASVYDKTSGELKQGANTEENVAAATKSMTELKSKINSQKKYNVSATMSEGIYVWVKIEDTDGGAASPSST